MKMGEDNSRNMWECFYF